MMMIVLARKKMTIDKITVNLYTCCKCNYQWTSWNGNQRAEEPIPKNCPKCRNVRWNQRYLDEELALVNRLQDELYETNLIGSPKVTESPATDPLDYLDYPLLCGGNILMGIIKLLALSLSNIFLQCA
jgi:hypothetical protein